MIAINERSFLAQASTAYEINTRMLLLKEIIEVLKLAMNSNEIVTCSNLCNVELAQGTTFNSWLHINTDDKYDLRMFFIITVKNGPFIDVAMRTSRTQCSCVSGIDDVSFTSVAAAAHQGGVLASLQDAGPMSAPQIQLSGCATVTVQNFSKLSQAQAIDRIYAPTDKHQPHGWGSTMDLDFTKAQSMLRAGIQVGDAVYNKSGEKYYIFRCDNVGGYHGYPVSRFEVPNKAKVILDT